MPAGGYWGVSTTAMPGSTGGAPQLSGGTATVPISRQVDARAPSPKGADQAGIASGGTN